MNELILALLTIKYIVVLLANLCNFIFLLARYKSDDA